MNKGKDSRTPPERKIMRTNELAWSDCKVAFSVDDEQVVWEHFGPGTKSPFRLPEGWELCQTDASGYRAVAVFRVDGDLTRKDGEEVAHLLVEIGAMQVASDESSSLSAD